MNDKTLEVRETPSVFHTQGRGYQTRINALLRAYVEAHPQPLKHSAKEKRRAFKE